MDQIAAGTSLKPLGLLEVIASLPHAPTLRELTAATGEPKPTLHRWLGTLTAADLVQRTPDGRRYELAPRSSRLAFAILANGPGGAVRHAILEQTVQRLGESCNFTVFTGTEVTYLDRVESHWPLRVTFQPGSKVPAHCSASGKLFLALMPPARRDLILDNLALERFTENTASDRAALESGLAAIRRGRYALDREEYMLGLVCLAVPIMQGQGRSRRCVAALALQAPVMRLSCEGALDRLPVLRDAAESLAATLE